MKNLKVQLFEVEKPCEFLFYQEFFPVSFGIYENLLLRAGKLKIVEWLKKINIKKF